MLCWNLPVQVYRNTLERTKSAAERIRTHKLTQAALAKTGDHLAALQVTAAKAGQTVSRHIDAAVASIEAQKAAKKGGSGGGAAAAAEAGSGAKDQQAPLADSSTRGLATESFDDAGEAAEVAAAAAAGDIVDAVLFAPGRLLYVKPIDETVAEEDHKFELVDGRGGGWCVWLAGWVPGWLAGWPAAWVCGEVNLFTCISPGIMSSEVTRTA